jgi:energy-coupling factor transporter ATP-binding protein EcfA2
MARDLTIHKATRTGAKARIALAGPTGSGKTWTGLSLATVLADGKGVLMVDTEHKASELYSDDFDFNALTWEPPFDPRELISFLRGQGSSWGSIVVDSSSHFYNGEGGLLSIVDAAGARAQGNSYAGWKTGTPIQNELIDTFLRLPCHLVVCMRSKMEYTLEKDDRGRSVPRKVGMAPIQRDGFEYEMSFVGDMDLDHKLTIVKSRYSALADKVYRPDHEKEFATELLAWLQTAKPEEAQPTPALELSPADSATFAEAVAPKAKPVKAPAKAQPTPPAEPTTQNVTADRVSLMNAIIQRITVQFPGTPERNAFLAKHGHDGSGMYVRFIQAADMDAMKAMAVELGVYA